MTISAAGALPQPLRPAWIDLDGVSLRYEYRRGRGPVLVLLHELGGSLESWDDVVALLPADVAILRYDQRGAGMSQKIAAPIALTEHVGDLRALIQSLRIEAAVALAGQAVGAAVAAAYALAHPSAVSHYVGLAPAMGVPPELQVTALLRAQALAGSSLRPDGEAIVDMAYPEALRTDQARYFAYRNRWLSTDSRSLGAMFEMLAKMNIGPELHRLSARSLFVAGTFDTFRPPAEVDRVARMVPHCEVLHIPSGHLMATQSPRLIKTLLAGFVHADAACAALCADFLGRPENRVGVAAHAA